MWSYPVLDPVSQAYPEVQGRSPTCYSPVRHSSTQASLGLSVRLACVKHAASVHPEPGSNSPQKQFQQKQAVKSPNPTKNKPTNTKCWTGKIQKLQRFKPTPNPTGQKQGAGQKIYVKHVQPHPTHTEPKDDAIHHWNSTTPPPAHTHNRAHTTQCTKRQANTPTQQKYIGTLSSSQTTPAHPPTRTKHGPSRKKRLRQKLHNQPTKSQTHVKPRLTRT